jgi:spermidine/putrescine transport system permease protein
MNRRRTFSATVTAFVLLFFYAPLVVLVANSFNASRFGGTWEGFTLHWYSDLVRNREVLEAFQRTMTIALWATPVATILGTLAAFALHRFHTRLQSVHLAFVQLPLVLPEVLMGFSLLLFFIATGWGLGMTAIWAAHVTFCISFVAMIILARLQDFDFTLLDAARDLGATGWQAAWRVLLPLLWPGILAGALLAFTLSIDDFVITFFVSGPGTTTLPVQIYSMMKTSRSLPVINALSALLLLVTVILVATSHWLTRASRKP